MGSMFACAKSFNQSLEGWKVSQSTITTHMFYGATSFRQPIELNRVVDNKDPTNLLVITTAYSMS